MVEAPDLLASLTILEQVCDWSEEIKPAKPIGRLLKEAEIVALGLTRLATVHARGVIALGKASTWLLAPAWAAARAACDAGARAGWLMQPQDVFEREWRWLQMHAAEARFGEDVAEITLALSR